MAELFEPVIPFTTEKLFKMLDTQSTTWNKCGEENLSAGHKLNQSDILFPKIEDEMIDQQISKLGGEETKSPKSSLISYEDFLKTELKVTEIIEAEKIEKSKKLLKLKVKLDDETRQVIAGIALSYDPENLVGKKVILVANLQPAKLMGEESNGMILAVEKDDGKLEVVSVDRTVSNGTRVR